MKNEQAPRRMVGLWILTIIIAVILAGVTIRFEIIKYSYKKDLARIEKTYVTLNRDAAAMEETKRRRVEYSRHLFFVDFPLRYAYGAADFMRRLSLIDKRNIGPVKLEITPNGQDLTFTLDIRVTGTNNTNNNARDIFSRYYRRLEDFEDLVEIHFDPINPGTGKMNRFKITGTIEL